MKTTFQFLKFTTIWLLSGVLILACKKSDTNPGSGNPPPGSQTGSASADSLSDHLQFFHATKKQGKIPGATTGSSLRISFEDTLYLIDEIKIPIKFLHTDTSQNVSGIFMQVHVAVIGGPLDATYYYDVPEISQMDSSDTVSVVMIGIDPAGLKIPQSFNITITPYNSSGLPITQVTRPVKILAHTIDPNGNSGSCGLVLPAGQYWDWAQSFIQDTVTGDFDFYNDPQKIFGTDGQDINGSCCDGGISVYGNCPGFSLPNKTLHFSTFYQITLESLQFFADKTYSRQTLEEAPFPVPDSSNFCGTGEGVVKANLNETIYKGNWIITPATLPPDLQRRYYKDSVRLSLLQTSTTGGGFGNPGGIINALACAGDWGVLELIQLDLEGFGKHLYKLYYRNKFGQDHRWFHM